MTEKKAAYIFLLITFCAWGSLYVVSKFMLGSIPPFTVSLIRYLIAGISLFVVLSGRKLKKIERVDYKYIFIIGFAGYFFSMGAQFIGTKLSNASLASLINSMNPITIMFFASIILKEKLTLKKVVCMILAIIGVYIIVGGVKGNTQIAGIVMSIISVITWSLVSVIIRKVTQKYDALQITAYGIYAAVIFTLPASVYELMTVSQVCFDWKVGVSLVYMGVVCTAVAHVLWNKSLSALEAGTCSLFYPLQPMVAVLLGCLFLGEKINTSFIIGAVLIIAGVMIIIVQGHKGTVKY